MNVVVVGAAGFVGGHLCRHLVANGHTVRGFDVVEPPSPLGVPFERGDVRSAEFGLDGVDAVFYLSQSPHYRSFPEQGDHLFGVNVSGALRVVERALEAGVRAVFYASTGSVYAPSFLPIGEDHPVRRDDPYALSKVTAEDALALVASGAAGEGVDRGLDITCLRFFGVFGGGQKTMLVPAIANRVREGQAITLQANPTDPDDDGGLRIALTHVDDVVTRCERLAAHVIGGGELPAVLNLAHQDATSLRQLGEALGEVLGRRPEFEVLEATRGSDFVADVTRMQQIVPGSFLPLDEAVRRTFGAGS